MVIAHFDGDFSNSGTVGSYALNATGETIDGALFKFGSGSATGVGSPVLTVPISPTVSFSGDWVCDAWVYGTGAELRVRDVDTNQEWSAFFSSGGTYLTRLDNVGDPVYEVFGTEPLPASTWTHVELSRVGGVVRAFVAGVLDASQADTTTLAVFELRIYSDSHVDEWRVVNGAGGHTAGFTPPSGPWV